MSNLLYFQENEIPEEDELARLRATNLHLESLIEDFHIEQDLQLQKYDDLRLRFDAQSITMSNSLMQMQKEIKFWRYLCGELGIYRDVIERMSFLGVLLIGLIASIWSRIWPYQGRSMYAPQFISPSVLLAVALF